MRSSAMLFFCEVKDRLLCHDSCVGGFTVLQKGSAILGIEIGRADECLAEANADLSADLSIIAADGRMC